MIVKNQISKGFYPKTWVLLIGFLSGFLAVAPAQGAKFVQVIEQKGPKVLLVKAQNAPLGEVLEEISSNSGIQFKIPEGLMAESVTLNIEEHNWAAVVHQVLLDFNSVSIWNEPTRLDQVFLLGSNKGSEASNLPHNTPRKQKRNNPDIPHSKKKRYFQPNESGKQNENFLQKQRGNLSEAQLKTVASGALASPLSEKLFEDSEIKQFFEQNGVKTIEDGEKPSLAVKVRRQAIKLMKALKHAVLKNNS
jgi:hypothetical protein